MYRNLHQDTAGALATLGGAMLPEGDWAEVRLGPGALEAGADGATLRREPEHGWVLYGAHGGAFDAWRRRQAASS